MPKVTMREGESLDSMLARFKREVKNSGVLEECRKREFFMNKATKREYKRKMAQLRKS